MFQRALPDVDGFGVITSTPGLIRSSQPVMCFGLPLRTTSTTTESLEKPLLGVRVPALRDDPVLDQAGHVGRRRERDDVGGLARVDRAALRSRGAERLAERDALAGAASARTRRSARHRPSSASSTPRAGAWCFRRHRVDAAFVDDDEELLLVESEEPPHPASTAARLIATIAAVKTAPAAGVIVISSRSPCMATCFG